MLMQLVDIFAAKLGEAFSFLVAGSTSTKAVTASVLSKAWRALPSTAVTVSGTSSSSPSSDSSDPSSRESFIRVIRDQPMALAYFLPQIVSELAAVHTDMQRSVRLNANSGDGTGENRQLLSPIHQLVERIKRGFVEALCAYWVKGSSWHSLCIVHRLSRIFHSILESALFYTHEDWSISRQTPESTIMLQQFTRFHKLMLRSVYRIIAGNDVTTTSRKNAFPPNLLDRIRTSLFNSMMTLLDGLHFVAMHPTAYSQWTLTKQAASESSGDVICVDPSNKDMRLLTVLGNVVHIRQQLLPTSMKVYELLFKSVAVQEAQVCDGCGQVYRFDTGTSTETRGRCRASRQSAL